MKSCLLSVRCVNMLPRKFIPFTLYGKHYMCLKVTLVSLGPIVDKRCNVLLKDFVNVFNMWVSFFKYQGRVIIERLSTRKKLISISFIFGTVKLSRLIADEHV